MELTYEKNETGMKEGKKDFEIRPSILINKLTFKK